MTPTDDLSPLPAEAKKVASRILRANKPLISAHIRLDGDAIGSALGLYHILKALGKRPHVANDSRIPQTYQFLAGVDEVGSPADMRSDYDLFIVLDTPSFSRTGAIADRLPKGLDTVCIDHHPPTETFGDPRWVDPAFSAVGEMVFALAKGSGWPISPEAATALYTAIVTDTGRFSFPNTTPSAFRAAAALLELGARNVIVSDSVYAQIPPPLLALQGELLQSLKTYSDDKVAVMSVTQDMLKRHGIDPIDTQEFADWPRCVAGVKVGVLLREMRNGKIKVSLRSREGVDIEPVARKFGGGGHHEASGCEIEGSLRNVESMVVRELETRHPWRQGAD